MRGLLFTGGRSPEPGLSAPLFGPYSRVYAADSGLRAALDAGVEPDFIVGDMDSIGDLSLLDRFPADRIRRWPADKDCTDTELALRLMAEEGIDEVVLVGGSGGRLDHLLALRALFDGARAPVLWITEENALFSVPAGTVLRVAGLSPEAPVSVFPAGPGPHRCAGSGFHWSIDTLSWDSGSFSLSNRADTGAIAVTALSGAFFAVVPLARGVVSEGPSPL